MLRVLILVLTLASAFAQECEPFNEAHLCSLSGKCGPSRAESNGNIAGAAFGCAMIFGTAWLRRRK